MREQYINSIMVMLSQIEDIRFLNQIRIILKRHIEKKGETA